MLAGSSDRPKMYWATSCQKLLYILVRKAKRLLLQYVSPILCNHKRQLNSAKFSFRPKLEIRFLSITKAKVNKWGLLLLQLGPGLSTSQARFFFVLLCMNLTTERSFTLDTINSV
jgi:hypothetical protein